MNFYKYLESRFVTSQLALNAKQTTSGHGENHAILALMWVVLKLTTAFYFALILIQYLAVLFHLATKPKEAKEIVAAAKLAAHQAKMEGEKFAQEIMAATMKERAEAGLDQLTKKGTA